jgi:hypothetical protein
MSQPELIYQTRDQGQKTVITLLKANKKNNKA